MDIYGLVMHWNPQAEKIFKFSRAEAMGKLLSDLSIPPLVREAYNHELEYFLKIGESSLLSKRIEVTAMRANGSEFPIVPIRNGDVLFFNAVIRDITSRKQAEHELTRLGRVLDESSNEIYVFMRKHCISPWSTPRRSATWVTPWMNSRG
jgi:PAS domain S-box-containing protein